MGYCKQLKNEQITVEELLHILLIVREEKNYILYQFQILTALRYNDAVPL